jgi:hypothetical protein
VHHARHRSRPYGAEITAGGAGPDVANAAP